MKQTKVIVAANAFAAMVFAGFTPTVATGANQISCAKISRETRELHASPRREIADSLANFTGIAIAIGSSMKTTVRNLLAALLFVARSLHGNGNVDGLFINPETATTLTQSFIPSL